MAGAALTSVFLLLLLVLPIIAGIMLIVASRRRGRGFPACGQCGYDVSGTLGTTTARCPECGSDFSAVGILPSETRTRRGPLVIGILMIVLPLTCIGTAMAFTYSIRSQSAQAAQLAQAAAAQQQALAQQALLVSTPADPAVIATFRPKVARMTVTEASMRMTAITQELAQRQVDQTLTQEIAGQLNAEFKALEEHMSSNPPLTRDAD